MSKNLYRIISIIFVSKAIPEKLHFQLKTNSTLKVDSMKKYSKCVVVLFKVI